VIENRGAAFDQGKPADGSGARDWLKGGKVNSVLQGRLARVIDDKGLCPISANLFAINRACAKLSQDGRKRLAEAKPRLRSPAGTTRE
jgi:hypothetical protein